MCAEKLDTRTRKNQIVQAALGIVQSQGLKAMTMEKIASVVGLVPSAIYRHFKNKEEVLHALLELIREGLLSNVKRACEETTSQLEVLRRLLMYQTHLIREFPFILPRILFSDEAITGNPSMKRDVYLVLNSYLDAIGDIIKKGQSTGEIRSDISYESLSVLFFGLFQPSAFLFLLSDGSFDIIRQTDKAWKIFREMIRAN